MHNARVQATRRAVHLGLALLAPACASVPRATVLYVTDAHEIAPVVDQHGDRGGVARLKAVVDARRREAPDALLVFGGDLAGGTLFGGAFLGEPMVDALGRVGVGLATLGQHDLDFGSEHARALVARSTFPWLSSNLVDREGRPFASLPPRRLMRVGGLRVGFLGVTDDVETTTQDGGVVQADPVEAAAREAAALRREGAEAVVALTQAGADVNRWILLQAPEVDAVLTEEESETESVVRWRGGRPVAAPRGNLGSVVELVLERRRGRVGARVAVHPVNATVVPDPALLREERAWTARLVEELPEPVGFLSEQLGHEGSRERESALGNLVADAFREAVGADVALVLGSSLRASLQVGPVTRRDVLAVQPFRNRVVAVEMTGAALRAALERGLATGGQRGSGFLQVSGISLEADLSAPEGHRLRAVLAGGAPLRDETAYRVAVSSHLASGGDGHAEIAGARRLAGPEPLDADALAEHLRRVLAVGPVPVPETGRISLRVPR